MIERGKRIRHPEEFEPLITWPLLCLCASSMVQSNAWRDSNLLANLAIEVVGDVVDVPGVAKLVFHQGEDDPVRKSVVSTQFW